MGQDREGDAPWVQPLFDPQKPVRQECPFCNHSLLSGGTKLDYETKLFFAYVNVDDKGALKYALIIPKLHHPGIASLPPDWGEWLKTMCDWLEKSYEVPQYNINLNVGPDAGQRLEHLHFWFIPAPAPGTPSHGLGLYTLREKYDATCKGVDLLTSLG